MFKHHYALMVRCCICQSEFDTHDGKLMAMEPCSSSQHVVHVVCDGCCASLLHETNGDVTCPLCRCKVDMVRRLGVWAGGRSCPVDSIFSSALGRAGIPARRFFSTFPRAYYMSILRMDRCIEIEWALQVLYGADPSSAVPLPARWVRRALCMTLDRSTMSVHCTHTPSLRHAAACVLLRSRTPGSTPPSDMIVLMEMCTPDGCGWHVVPWHNMKWSVFIKYASNAHRMCHVRTTPLTTKLRELREQGFDLSSVLVATAQ